MSSNMQYWDPRHWFDLWLIETDLLIWTKQTPHQEGKTNNVALRLRISGYVILQY